MLENLEPGWLWLIGGVLLLIAEVIAPGFFLVFIGAAAIATGVFTLLFDLGTAGAARPVRPLRSHRGHDRPARSTRMQHVDSTDPLLNDRAARLIGKSGDRRRTRSTSMTGRVRVGDSEWSARGGPAAAGERVRITGVDGNCLTVEARARTCPQPDGVSNCPNCP